MGIFSSIKAALSDPDVRDRVAAIGSALEGDPNAYANYQAQSGARHAAEAASAQMDPAPVAPAAPDPAPAQQAPVQAPAQAQPQSDLDIIRLPFGASALPMRSAADSDPAPVSAPAPRQANPVALPGNQYMNAAMPDLMKAAAYGADPVGAVTKLIQMRDQLARQQAFLNAYNARQSGAQTGGQGSIPQNGNPAMRDYQGIAGANDANQLFDMAAATYGPEVANSMRDNWKAAQPTYTTINGRQYVSSGLHAMDQATAPEDKDGFTYVPDSTAPGGYRAVATAGYQPINNSKTGGAALANGIKPPVDGATPVVSGYDSVTGIPNVTGWKLPNGTVQAVGSVAAARAAGEGSVKPYAYANGDGSQTLTNETSAATGRGNQGRHIGPTYGTKDTYEGAVKDYQGFQADRDSAQTTIANVNQLGNLLGSMQTGKLSPMGNEISAAAQAAGLPGDYRNLTNAQAITTINKNMIGELRKQAGMTRLTDADLKFLNAGLPGIANTPQGNAAALSYMGKMAQRRVDKATAADNWVNAYGSLASPGKGGPNFNAAWSIYQAKNPVFAGGGR